MKYRTREEILVRVLSSLKQPLLKTQLMYDSRMNFVQLKSYYDYLWQNGLVNELDGKLVASEKGIQYLLALEAASRILKKI